MPSFLQSSQVAATAFPQNAGIDPINYYFQFARYSNGRVKGYFPRFSSPRPPFFHVLSPAVSKLFSCFLADMTILVGLGFLSFPWKQTGFRPAETQRKLLSTGGFSAVPTPIPRADGRSPAAIQTLSTGTSVLLPEVCGSKEPPLPLSTVSPGLG